MLSVAALGGGAYAVAYARVMLPWQTRKVAEARKLRGDLSVNVERSGACRLKDVSLKAANEVLDRWRNMNHARI
jgi:hypothetical protein